MKNIIILTILTLVSFIGCDIYEQESYPTLSGRYVLEVIHADEINPVTGEKTKVTLLDGTYLCNKGVEPLDVLDIGEMIGFSYGEFFADYRLNGYGGAEWGFRTYYSVPKRHFSGGKYDEIRIEYFGGLRKFIIEEDEIQKLVLRSYSTWTDVNTGKKYENFNLVLFRVGP